MNYAVGLFGGPGPVMNSTKFARQAPVRFGGDFQTSEVAPVGDTFRRNHQQLPRVLLVEDHTDLIEMVREYAEEIELTGVATSYDEAIRLFREQKPDIVLLDKNIIGPRTGVDIHHTLRDEFGFPETRMIFTSSERILPADRGQSPQIEKSEMVLLSAEHPVMAKALDS